MTLVESPVTEVPTLVLCEHCEDAVQEYGDHFKHLWLDPSPILKTAMERGFIDKNVSRYCRIGPWEARHGREATPADYTLTYEATPRVSYTLT